MAIYLNNKEFTSRVVAYQKLKYKTKQKNILYQQLFSDFYLMSGEIVKTFHNFQPVEREDMVHNATIHCMKKLPEFNIKLSKNAFAYYTQIIYRVFLQYIRSKKHQENIKINFSNHYKYKHNATT